ncbi:hypothetical protein CEXT_221231 [Caerostris extrusa]|uniref:Uncharacterized protein n=1 Tax=Caerostris extrusa TaxID=172846 RepID=A0AAV4UI64_CAEEX|nr:hypothetical protein CEXT_221231 [Caerostris extrusa]
MSDHFPFQPEIPLRFASGPGKWKAIRPPLCRYPVPESFPNFIFPGAIRNRLSASHRTPENLLIFCPPPKGRSYNSIPFISFRITFRFKPEIPSASHQDRTNRKQFAFHYDAIRFPNRFPTLSSPVQSGTGFSHHTGPRKICSYFAYFETDTVIIRFRLFDLDESTKYPFEHTELFPMVIFSKSGSLSVPTSFPSASHQDRTNGKQFAFHYDAIRFPKHFPTLSSPVQSGTGFPTHTGPRKTC